MGKCYDRLVAVVIALVVVVFVVVVCAAICAAASNNELTAGLGMIATLVVVETGIMIVIATNMHRVVRGWNKEVAATTAINGATALMVCLIWACAVMFKLLPHYAGCIVTAPARQEFMEAVRIGDHDRYDKILAERAHALDVAGLRVTSGGWVDLGRQGARTRCVYGE